MNEIFERRIFAFLKGGGTKDKHVNSIIPKIGEICRGIDPIGELRIQICKGLEGRAVQREEQMKRSEAGLDLSSTRARVKTSVLMCT